MNIIAWAILGIIAGAIAKAIYPGTQGGGLLSTMILGIIGAFIGGSVVTLLTTGQIGLTAAGFSIPGVIVAVIGAIIAIFLWGLITRNAA
ncbi:GlsB/YeaQ/YmgE family stress response membrane protein [Phormidesmis sp. 146-35]